jgi:hypothetical protein
MVADEVTSIVVAWRAGRVNRARDAARGRRLLGLDAWPSPR